MKLEKKISDLKKLQKRLNEVAITTRKLKNGTIKVKWGKKRDLLIVPDQEWGNKIKEVFQAVLKNQAESVEEILYCLEKNYEQLSLNLFGGTHGNSGQELGEEAQRRISDSVGEDQERGDEHQNGVHTGVDSDTGKPPLSSGAERSD